MGLGNGDVELHWRGTSGQDFFTELRRHVRARASASVVPSPFVLHRRTATERRAYLTEHRAEAIAHGIPEDLIDLMIADGDAA